MISFDWQLTAIDDVDAADISREIGLGQGDGYRAIAIWPAVSVPGLA